jgi:DNA-binding NtrC family response regulator
MLKTILLVEDEKNTRSTVSIILKSAGYDVMTAENYDEAVRKIQEAKKSNKEICLIITDLQLPGKSGKDLVSEIKQMGIKAPVIVISGFIDRETIAELKKIGCREYIEKPFSAETLLEAIRRVVYRGEN